MSAQVTGKIDVEYVANLARLHLTEVEIGCFQGQLEHVLAYVEQLQQLDVSGIEPMAHAIPVDNVFRADEPKACLDRELVLANAPTKMDNQFTVPKIIE